MRPDVVIAILASILASVTGGHQLSRQHSLCGKNSDNPCGEERSRIDEGRCAKVIGPTTYKKAKEHCYTIKGHLFTTCCGDDINQLRCRAWPTNICVGAKGSEGVLINADGSEFMLDGELNNGKEACIKLSFVFWFDVYSSKEQYFVCIKKHQ